ncbi:MAG: CDP-alcohol phosphatidyltransferase family protein [bacterium]
MPALTWPNFVTIARLVLLFVLVMFAYGSDLWTRLLAAVIALVVIIGDWLDGHLARRLHQATTLGSLLDVAADRIVESVLWIVLADLRLIPVWIPVVIISRGILTDTLRGYALQFGHSGFGAKTMMQSKAGKWLTGSPFMRTSYAVLKAFSFTLLLMLAVAREFATKWSVLSRGWVEVGLDIGYWAAVLAAVVCLLRGIPVMVEGYILVRQKGDNA